ncbi:MAG TPA: hypothetical protein VM943_11705 [Pyrinomonadaceae bacterium]|nr:hypothetical protein [Pyrinomonadaceae bacterium]
MSSGKQSDDDSTMRRRRVTLEDGRYLIFYTFDDLETPPPSDAKSSAQQPDTVPIAEDEPRV